MWQDDALWLGPAIAQRMKAQIPALRTAQVMDDLSPDTVPQQLPAGVVVLFALQPDDSIAKVAAPTVRALWLATVVVANRRPDPDAQRTEAGPLLAQAIKAVHGWRPDGLAEPLRWAPGGPRPYYTKSFSAYPLMFEAVFSTATGGGARLPELR